MSKDLDVPPSGSGHSAEPESQGVSAQGASVPNAGWTKGPWEIYREALGYAYMRAPNDKYEWRDFVCVVVAMEGEKGLLGSPEGRANARLVAAAPEMAEMLSAVVNAYDRPDATPVSFNNAVISLVRDARTLLARVREQP